VKSVRVTIHGESYMSLEAVAECYDCEVAWMRDVYALGLLGSGRTFEGTLVIRTSMLDRVATIRRLHLYQGLDLALVGVFLDADED
jgi:hypothetical protein